MYISSKDGDSGAKAELKSEHMMLYEGDTKCLSFWYIFDTDEGAERSLESLSIYTIDTEDHEYKYWELNTSSPHWTLGQVNNQCRL